MNTALRFPLCSVVFFTLALILAGCGDDDQSQSEVEYLSHMDQARFFQRQGELKASTQEARSAIQAKPEQIEPYFVIIDNLITAGDGRNAERQLSELRERIDDEQEHRANVNRIAVLKARARLLQGNTEEALDALTGLQDAEASLQVEALVVEGDVFQAMGRNQDAREAYLAAREVDSRALMPVIGLSRLAYLEQDKEQARELLAEAQELAPQDPELWLWKGQLAHREGDLEAAREGYTNALEDIGRYDVMTYRKYETISALIDVLQRMGEASQAFVYEEILASSVPGTIRSGLEAARDEYERGNLARAANHLEEILQHAPDHQNASILLGMIRFQQGRVQEAEELLAPHAEHAETGELTRVLAAARIQLQRPEEAREMLEELDPDKSDPGVVALMGIAALAADDDELGRELVERSLSMAPDNATLRSRYARYLLSRDEVDVAIEQLETAIERVPQADEPRMLLAQVYARLGQQDTAEAVIDQWRKDQPDNIRAINTGAELAQARGETDRARELYRQAIEVNPEAPESHYSLGALEARLGNREQAESHFRNAVRAAPDSQQALQALVSLTRDDAQALEGTMSFLRDLSEEREDSIGPRLALLEYALQQGDIERAENLANAVETRIDQSASARDTIGGVFRGTAERALNNDDLERARRIIRLGRERYREHEGLALVEARLQFQRERPREAREILRNVKTMHPDSPRPFVTEANYHAGRGELDQALELYQLARNKQDSPDLIMRKATVQRQAGKLDAALELLREGAQSYPEQSRLHLNLAMAYQADDQREEAIEAYRRTINLDPNNAVALNNLAWMYQEDGREEALQLAERAYRLQPRNASIADTYGWILLQRGQIEQSLEVLEAAHELAPDSRDIAEHLAEAYRAAGDDTRAEQLLQGI